jgi:lysozyme
MIESAVTVAKFLIAHFEGFYSTPYLCPAGVPTIGYGFTYYRDGTAVTLGDLPMAHETADALLDYLIRTKYMMAVMALCNTIDTPERLAAITDFCFNLGYGTLRVSTLRQRINAGAWNEVPTQLLRWVKAGGRTLPGLVIRRATESSYV